MGKYSLVFSKSVRKDLRALPSGDVVRILKAFDWLSYNPRGPGCTKLCEQERYRYKVGKYRILYEIRDAVLLISVVKVAHGREAYR